MSWTRPWHWRIREFPGFERNSPRPSPPFSFRPLWPSCICRNFSQLLLTRTTLLSLLSLKSIGELPKVNMSGLDSWTEERSVPLAFRHRPVYVHAVGLKDQVALKRRVWNKRVSAIHVCMPLVIDSFRLMYFRSWLWLCSSTVCISLAALFLVCWVVGQRGPEHVCFVENLLKNFGFRFLKPR